MRNRTLRVVLTSITLILLMFTVISFTSVRTYLQFYKVDRQNVPNYNGMLIRNNAWWPLEDSALRYLQGEFQDQAAVVPRAWYANQPAGEWSNIFIKLETRDERLLDETTVAEYRSITDALQGTDLSAISDAQEKLTRQSFKTFAKAIMGLSPREPEISGIDEILKAGRWFVEGDHDVCILPDNMAEILGIGVEDAGTKTVLLYGRPVLVIGILDGAALYGWRDLDDGHLTPVDYKAESSELRGEVRTRERQTEGEEDILSFKHMLADEVVFMPYQDVRNMNNGNVMSVAIKFPDTEEMIASLEDFMPRVGLTVFVGADGKSTVYSALALTALSGLENLFIPVLIAALIVLNTMMGVVYERIKEIGIFSAVGLAPTHIGALFMAESCVYAIIGGMAGYLVGQSFSQIVTYTGVLEGLTLNYSSTSAVTSTITVMAVVLLSTVYPARKASQMAVPDVEREWRFPEPDGDVWQFEFPFTVSGTEVLGLSMYLREYFQSHGEDSVGLFHADRIVMENYQSSAGNSYRIGLRAWLSPYDMGISEDVVFDATPMGEFDIYRIDLAINRLSGDSDSWQRVNRRFLNAVRKQFLVWRTVDGSTKQLYNSRALKSLEA